MLYNVGWNIACTHTILPNVFSIGSSLLAWPTIFTIILCMKFEMKKPLFEESFKITPENAIMNILTMVSTHHTTWFKA